MDSKEVRVLAKKVLMKKKFIKAVDLKLDTWTADVAKAWKNFTYSVPHFSKYASKVPSQTTISPEDIKVLKGLIVAPKQKEVVEEVVEEPIEAPVPEEEVEAPVEEIVSEDPTSVEEAPEQEESAEETSEEAPVEEVKEAPKKGRKSKK